MRQKRLYFASLSNCNENCVFCVKKGDNPPVDFIDTKKAKKFLAKKVKEGFNAVCFDGGEPTLRKDLPELVDFCRKTGFSSVSILTNGVKLAENAFTKKLLQTRGFPLSFSVSLHSHKKNISEKMTGAKNTYAKTLKGLENLIAEGCKNISIYHVIAQYNFRDLPDFVRFVATRFPAIKYITFSFIYPAGAALKNMDIYPRLSQVQPYFQEAAQLCRELGIVFSLSTCGTVPLCFLKEHRDVLLRQQELDRPENVGVLDSGQNVSFKLASPEFHKKTKLKSQACVRCSLNKKCGGLWHSYAEKYGLGELRPILKDERKKEGTFLVMTGFSCNNNCAFCSNIADRSMDRSFEEICADIERGHRERYGILEFIGGEATIRSDFLDLVAFARNSGFDDVAVTSNGRMFSYGEFAEKAAAAGLSMVNVSLYGHNKVLHEGATRTPGSFDQCVEGIKNILKTGQMMLAVNTVISKLNYKYLDEMGKFISGLGAEEWHLLELIPDGLGKKNYASLAPSYSAIFPFMVKIKKYAGKMRLINIFDFPFCILGREAERMKNITFATPKERFEDMKQIGFNPICRIKKTKKKGQTVYLDGYRTKPEFCKRCRHYFNCGGATKEQIKIYGEGQIKELFKKANEENGRKKISQPR